MIEYQNAFIGPDSVIECDVKHPVYGWISTTLVKDDSFDNGAYSIPELYTHIYKSHDLKPLPQHIVDARAGYAARNDRDRLLKTRVDPIANNVFRFSALDRVQSKQLQDYRQALLDLPEQPGFPHNIVWPKLPEFIAS